MAGPWHTDLTMEEVGETSRLDTFKDFFKRFLKILFIGGIVFWLLLEFFFSTESARPINRTAEDILDACKEVAYTREDAELVGRLRQVLGNMYTGTFQLTGQKAQEFGEAFFAPDINNTDDARTMLKVYFNKSRDRGFVRYKYGLDWVVQLEFRPGYVCKSIETTGEKFNGNVLVYAWNHSLRRIFWTHPRYLCEVMNSTNGELSSYYTQQAVGHKWFSFLNTREREENPEGYVSERMRASATT